MPAPPVPRRSRAQARTGAPPIGRSAEERVVAGVAGGLGPAFGVDPLLLRLGFVVLAFAGGVGLLLYAVLAAFLRVRAPSAGGLPPTVRGAGAWALVVTGALLVCRSAGLWLGDALVWPVALAAVGSALVYTRLPEPQRDRWARLATSGAALDGRRRRLLAVAAGGALVLLALGALVVTGRSLRELGDVVVALAVAATGAALLVGPFLQGLLRQVDAERRARIRSEERADMAAHLHDSVLQTLALIQRSPDAAEAARLARSQERELRAWLFGRDPGRAARRLGAAVEDAAARVEERFGVRVEVVLVGDCDLDPRLRALVDAATEAMANAARHSGASAVAVYVEVTPHDVTVFVRDEGTGFDPKAVPADRRGLTASIRGRIERHGGRALVETAPGEGTEVELSVPRAPRGGALVPPDGGRADGDGRHEEPEG